MSCFEAAFAEIECMILRVVHVYWDLDDVYSRVHKRETSEPGCEGLWWYP